jgi:glycosyltransferase involved in cell wall biosynthesis
MSNLVSILIPAFNSEQWIEGAITSALSQSWPEIEIIVVDDGSTDSTPTLVEQFEDDGVRLIVQEHAGAAAARNTAFRASTGDFIQYLDADDFLHPLKIECQLNALEQHGADCVANSLVNEFLEDIEQSFTNESYLCQTLEPLDYLVYCVGEVSWMMIPGVWLIPRGIVEAAGPWNEKLTLNDDGEYFSRIVLNSRLVVYCEDACYYYRRNVAGSLSNRGGDEPVESTYLAFALIAKRLLAREDSQRTRIAIARCFRYFVYTYYPQSPHLIKRAVSLIEEMGGYDYDIGHGAAFRALKRIAGWRTAYRLRYYLHRLRGIRKL